VSVRLPLALAAAALLAGCDNPPTGDTPSSPVGAGGPVGGNAANMVEEVSPREAGDLPPPSEGLRFIGKWAADERSCESAAWQFTQTTLRTPAGSVCGFDRVTEVPGGYDIQATCTAEAPPTSDMLKIRFAESAKAMLFESETIADAGLVFCGRDA
jgi:hypothetical protein